MTLTNLQNISLKRKAVLGINLQHVYQQKEGVQNYFGTLFLFVSLSEVEFKYSILQKINLVFGHPLLTIIVERIGLTLYKPF